MQVNQNQVHLGIKGVREDFGGASDNRNIRKDQNLRMSDMFSAVMRILIRFWYRYGSGSPRIRASYLIL
jgi:hypothetical protein